MIILYVYVFFDVPVLISPLHPSHPSYGAKRDGSNHVSRQSQEHLIVEPSHQQRQRAREAPSGIPSAFQPHFHRIE